MGLEIKDYPTGNDQHQMTALLYQFMKWTNVWLPVAERRTWIGKVMSVVRAASSRLYSLTALPAHSPIQEPINRTTAPCLPGAIISWPFNTLRVNKSDLREAATNIQVKLHA